MPPCVCWEHSAQRNRALQEKREAAPAFRPGDVVTQEHLMKALYARSPPPERLKRVAYVIVRAHRNISHTYKNPAPSLGLSLTFQVRRPLPSLRLAVR